MGKTTVLVVDDNGQELAMVERELSKRYGADYNVVAEHSAQAALDKLQALNDAEEQVAIVLADLWMPEMTGVDFLKQAHDIHSAAKRVILVNWGDPTIREPLLQASTFGWIDAYTGKPTSALDETFHRLITELLDTWCRQSQTGAVHLEIVDEQWSPRAYELRDLMNRYSIPFRFHNLDSETGRTLCEQAGKMQGPFPVVFLYNGEILTDPTNDELAEGLGADPEPEIIGEVDVIIIGSGPAGLSAAVYGASEGLQTLVIEREAIGGQAGTSPLIRNYLGFPLGISGSELASRAYNQALQFGATFYLMREVSEIRVDDDKRVVVLADGTEIASRAIILAMGVTYRRLEIPRLEALLGAGVFYGGTVTEAQAMGGQRVFVAGAGNSAGQAALHVARYAEHVTLVVRGDALDTKMSEYLIKEIEATANVEVCLNTEIVDGYGTQRLEGLVLKDTRSGETQKVPAAALFVLIGAQPHTEWLPDGILRDRHGFIITGQDLKTRELPNWTPERIPFRFETSIPGVFAVGDARYRSVKRVASAVGEGGTAIQMVHEYLSSTLES